MMTTTINRYTCSKEYDVIQATIDGFKKSVQRFRRRPDNDSYFWDMFRHMQFMQTDEIFEMTPEDVDDLIDSILEESGMSQTAILSEAYQCACFETQYLC